MWAGPIHDPGFVGEVLEHLEESKDKYGTADRMKGMMTVAKEVCTRAYTFLCYQKTSSTTLQELASPFYFTPSKVAGSFHCLSPSLDQAAFGFLYLYVWWMY